MAGRSGASRRRPARFPARRTRNFAHGGNPARIPVRGVVRRRSARKSARTLDRGAALRRASPRGTGCGRGPRAAGSAQNNPGHVDRRDVADNSRSARSGGFRRDARSPILAGERNVAPRHGTRDPRPRRPAPRPRRTHRARRMLAAVDRRGRRRARAFRPAGNAEP